MDQGEFFISSFKHKKCTQCKKVKPLVDKFWPKNIYGASGWRSVCKECTNLSNRERQKRRGQIWNKTKQWNQVYKKYGLTVDQYFQMLEKQGGGCWICGSTDPGRKISYRLSIDHCHKSGVVRGLLCSPCNTIIGFVERASNYEQVVGAIISYLNLDENKIKMHSIKMGEMKK